MAWTRQQIEALIDVRPQVAIPNLEHSMGERMNAILREASTVSLQLHSDMARSKALHQGEVAKLFGEQAGVDDVVARQNTTKEESDALIEKLKIEFAKVKEVSTNLEQRAAGVI